MNLHDQIVAGLTLMGCKVVPGRSKYTELEYPHFKSGHKFFVGRNGALRKGPCASRSVSIGDASNQTGFYYRLRSAAQSGVFKMCGSCAHYHDAGKEFSDPKTGRVFSGRCAKLDQQPCKTLNLLCGGDFYVTPKDACDPKCPLCIGRGTTTPHGSRCSCIWEKHGYMKQMAVLLANARESYKTRGIFLVVADGHIIAGADGVISRFANDEAAIQALVQAGYTRDEVTVNPIFHP